MLTIVVQEHGQAPPVQLLLELLEVGQQARVARLRAVGYQQSWLLAMRSVPQLDCR